MRENKRELSYYKIGENGRTHLSDANGDWEKVTFLVKGDEEALRRVREVSPSRERGARRTHGVHGHDDEVKHPVRLVQNDWGEMGQGSARELGRCDSRAPESVKATIVARRPATATGDMRDRSVWKGLIPIVPLPM